MEDDSLLFPASRGGHVPHRPFLHRQAGLVFSHGMLTSLPSSSTLQDPCDYIEPTQIIPHHLLSQGQLMSNLNSICNLHSPL